MKFECYYRILKEFSILGVVKVLNLVKSFKVIKEIICLDFNEFVGQGYFICCYGGVFIIFDFFDNVVKNEIVYVLEKYELVQKIKKGFFVMKNNVCVIGLFNVDIISYLLRLFLMGELLLVDKFIFLFGGKGCNQVLVVSYVDFDVYFIIKVGLDYFSDYVINFINLLKIYKSVIYQIKEI